MAYLASLENYALARARGFESHPLRHKIGIINKMKFKKAVLIKIADDHFDPKYLDKLNSLVEEKVSLTLEDPQLERES